jgi:DNA-binding transcriptional LysR family regulator
MLDSLSGITAFVQVAETRSFTEAGRLLEISSSAVGKSVARMEERLGVRLFHRITRSVTLTAEGEMFLERCRRIIQEAEQAEIELSQLAESPRGKLRISVPLQNTLIFPLLSGFMQAYPQPAVRS